MGIGFTAGAVTDDQKLIRKVAVNRRFMGSGGYGGFVIGSRVGTLFRGDGPVDHISGPCRLRGVLRGRISLPDQGQGLVGVASKKVGEVSVTYSSGTSSTASVSTDLADLTETSFGLQLLSLLKLYSLTRYVP